MCLFTSALRASVNKSHIPSLPQNNLYINYNTQILERTADSPMPERSTAPRLLSYSKLFEMGSYFYYY